MAIGIICVIIIFALLIDSAEVLIVTGVGALVYFLFFTGEPEELKEPTPVVVIKDLQGTPQEICEADGEGIWLPELAECIK